MKMKRNLHFWLATLTMWLCLFGCDSSPKYVRKVPFSNGLYKVESKEGKIGVIDSIGNIIVPVCYRTVYYDTQFNNLIHAELLSGKELLFGNKSGYPIIFPEYEKIQIEKVDTDTLIIARKRDNIGIGYQYLFSMSGEQLTHNDYTNIHSFSEGLSVVDYSYAKVDPVTKEIVVLTKAGFIDKTGKEVIPVVFDYADSFGDGLALVAYKGLFGFINHKGQEVIPYMFQGAGIFSETTPSLAGVMLFGKWGFINKEGKVVIPFIYDKIGGFFQNDCIEVQVKAERYFIDTDGNRCNGKEGLCGLNKIRN